MQKISANTSVRRFLQGISFHIQRKDGINTTSRYYPKETVTAIMMLYKNTKTMVCPLDNDTDFFDIVFQADTLALYICL